MCASSNRNEFEKRFLRSRGGEIISFYGLYLAFHAAEYQTYCFYYVVGIRPRAPKDSQRPNLVASSCTTRRQRLSHIDKQVWRNVHRQLVLVACLKSFRGTVFNYESMISCRTAYETHRLELDGGTGLSGAAPWRSIQSLFLHPSLARDNL